MNKSNIFTIIVIVILAGLFLVYRDRGKEPVITPPAASTESDTMGEVMEDNMKMNIDGGMMEEMMKAVYDYKGELADVSGGSARGMAKATFAHGAYNLLATFETLPDLKGTDFYEGWVVRKGTPMSIVSTGKVEKHGTSYMNVYRSGQDLTDHTFYVLTLEPDDGDPAPAKHILEGMLVEKGM